MTSNSFRESVSGLGWSRRVDPEPSSTTTTAPSSFLSTLRSINPFSQEGGGYLRLPTVEGAPLPAANRRDEEESFFARTSFPFLVCLHDDINNGWVLLK